MFAQSIHNASRRRQSPFVAVNCAAIPDTLIESELFGYEEGLLLGHAKGESRASFKPPITAPFFLMKLATFPLFQSRLLRVLEEREVMPVGSTSVIPIDVRVICATNRNLNEMVRQGTFREDLYYRLKILPLVIPPLRERVEDIRNFSIPWPRCATSSTIRAQTFTLYMARERPRAAGFF